MKILCPITDWDTRIVAKGFAVGNEITTRYVIAGDSWGWNISLQNKGKDPAGKKFWGNMKTFFYALPEQCEKEGILEGLNPQTIVETIVKALVEKTGKRSIPIPLLANKEDLFNFGKKIDDIFGTSYMREYPPQVISRIFKTTEEEVEDGVEA